MHNIGLGDVIFILLILGVIHGAMRLATMGKNRKSKDSKDPSNS